MSTRAYDYIVQVANATNFVKNATVIGKTSNSVGEIISIDQNNLKIRMANNYQSFTIGENIFSNTALMYTSNVLVNYTNDFIYPLPIANVFSDSVLVYVNNRLLETYKYNISNNTVILDDNYFTHEQISSNADVVTVQIVVGNIFSGRFVASNQYGQITTANSVVNNISYNPYINEKNSSSQTPVVKLYSIYYPGEWYPPNANGNPSNSGEGFPWPYKFPLRFAEFVGETYGDFDYTVSMGGTSYKVVALNGSEIAQDTTGKINSTILEISNFDGSIVSLVENEHLVGFNSSNAGIAIVNGELVTNIDKETIIGSIDYNSDVVAVKGANATLCYETTTARRETWTALKEDSRDLLGAAVEIKITYAKFLDFWPEYSLINNISSNVVTVRSSAPYRIGDNVKYSSNLSANSATITNIIDNNIYISGSFLPTIGDKLLIVNSSADSDSYVQHTFHINRLDELNDLSAKFNLTNWMQYFKKTVPSRKYYNNTCPWRYKGPECKYPVNGSGPIIGSNPEITSNGFFTHDNVSTLNLTEDICSKTYQACALRHNIINFGGFIKND